MVWLLHSFYLICTFMLAETLAFHIFTFASEEMGRRGNAVGKIGRKKT